MTLHFKKLEFPKPNTFLCQVLLKFAQWFWRRRRKCTNKKNARIEIQRDVKLSPDMKWSEENHLNFQHRCTKILNVTSAMCICSIQCFAIIVIASRLLYNYRQIVDQRKIRTYISTCRHRHFICLWFGSTSKKLLSLLITRLFLNWLKKSLTQVYHIKKQPQINRKTLQTLQLTSQKES